ncbi:uncharacterized protein RHO25_007977 [Cercospora beticola]|uniref:Uncharacterized protein n=1 Tax=Cercospora beticola TaxID=122368 RepID=A0ABZ0NV03_CERBT|nr:hypothetical protein RHO25_007977 [Cercospora beticola]CAK1357939.1 unnamed protein product [Cercospora beticola]
MSRIMTTLMLCMLCSAEALGASSVIEQYGVAFSLTNGYDVASAYLPNGTYLDIAKVEGGRAYKTFMRSMPHPEDGTSRLLEGYPSRGPSRCPLPGPLCYLWPDNGHEDDILIAIIRAMKASSEAALEHHVEKVLLGVPCLLPTYAFNKLVDVFDKSLRNAGLLSPHRAQHNRQYAGIDKGINFDCLFPPPQDTEHGEEADDDTIVLAVEATRNSLSLSIWHAECAMWELMRQAPQSFELGSMALTVCREQQDPRCLQELEGAIRQVAAVPIDAGGAVDDRTGTVVVSEKVPKTTI